MKKEITGNTLVDYPRLQQIEKYMNQTKDLDGYVAEVGVYKGGTAYLIASLAGNKHVYLFDTFKGMPEVKHWIDLHHEGDFNDTSEHKVADLLEPFGRNVSIHAGIFPKDTHGVVDHEKFSFVHLDCDIYDSVKDSLEFFYPKMVSGGVILFDDYNEPNCPGAKKAVDEFLADKPEKLILTVQSQSGIIKQ